jgi:hypothetical protein
MKEKSEIKRRQVGVRFVGVCDTVGAYGLPIEELTDAVNTPAVPDESPSTRTSWRSSSGAMKTRMRPVSRLACRSPSPRTFRASKGSRMRTRNVRSKTGDNCVVRSAAIHFFHRAAERFCRLAEVTRHFRCGAPSSLSFRVLKRTTSPGARLRALIRLRPVPVNTKWPRLSSQRIRSARMAL